MYQIPKLPLQLDVETKAVLKQLNSANKKLAELKGVALTIPNESILINTLILQEAKESSAVENIITTHDDLYKADAELKSFAVSASTKEVVLYARALKRGFDLIRNNKILTLSIIKEVQEVNVSRVTATAYLNKLISNGLLEKLKLGHSNFYLNTALTQILIEHSPKTDNRFEKIESISKII